MFWHVDCFCAFVLVSADLLCKGFYCSSTNVHCWYLCLLIPQCLVHLANAVKYMAVKCKGSYCVICLLANSTLMLAFCVCQWLEQVCNRIWDRGVFSEFSRRPNHVLVNEYLPGQGIMVCFYCFVYFNVIFIVRKLFINDVTVVHFYVRLGCS